MQLKDLTFSYGIEKIFENVNLIINENEHIGIVGVNGAGKTTLMRTLMGLYSSSGSIVIDGCDMRLNEAAAKERLGIVIAIIMCND